MLTVLDSFFSAKEKHPLYSGVRASFPSSRTHNFPFDPSHVYSLYLFIMITF